MFAWAYARAVAVCPLAALIWVSAPVEARAAEIIAMPDKVAVLALPAPPRTSGAIYLDLRISAYTPPLRGAVDAVVVLAGGGRETEIGRVTVFPNQAFTAKDGEPGRSYRFNVTSALAGSAAGPLELRVRLVPIDPNAPIVGAQMTIGGAEFLAGP
jgi:hypothetical protein